MVGANNFFGAEDTEKGAVKKLYKMLNWGAIIQNGDVPTKITGAGKGANKKVPISVKILQLPPPLSHSK